MENKKILVAPSILSANFADLKTDIARVEQAGADYLHIDVMDGHFVPNITIGAPVVKALKKYSNLVFDCHLMISEPQKYVDDFVDAGADERLLRVIVRDIAERGHPLDMLMYYDTRPSVFNGAFDFYTYEILLFM